jgi:hypothetical protein
MEAFGFLKREDFVSIFEYDGNADFAVSGINADCEVNHSALSCVMDRHALSGRRGVVRGFGAQSGLWKNHPAGFTLLVSHQQPMLCLRLRQLILLLLGRFLVPEHAAPRL